MDMLLPSDYMYHLSAANELPLAQRRDSEVMDQGDGIVEHHGVDGLGVIYVR
jgi:hypothetical protein